MTVASFVVRPLQPDDNFDRIERLFYQTHFERTASSRPTRNIAYRQDNWKQLLFPQPDVDDLVVLKNLVRYGFVAEVNGVMRAFATVGISNETLNGFLDYGFEPDSGFMLSELIAHCESVVRERGGKRLYRGTGMPLGQIRNDDITFLEAQGFRCNSFYYVFMDHRNIAGWNAPDDLDLASVQVASALEMKEISAILEEDREFFLAEEFRGNFRLHTPDHVFLCLYEQGQIKGIAYYKVWEKKGSFLAMALGIHFRPRFEVTRGEIRRFIQATLASMQQLGVTAVWSRVSSQSFMTLLELSAEGFDLVNDQNVTMIKPV